MDVEWWFSGDGWRRKEARKEDQEGRNM